ncbi:hypothetical protein ASG94_02540 [Nocardioides sp. Soil805]|nr:hypothetical protein ASG94_02540 [Nocardioides sp. Soil805]
MTTRLRPVRRVEQERDRARSRLAATRERLTRVRARLDRTRTRLEAERAAGREARADADDLRDELHATYARLAEVDDDLHETRAALDHYMALDTEHEARVAGGMAALFDYPYHPQPRTFGRPGRTFFEDLVGARDEEYAELLGRISGHLAPLAAVPEAETDPLLPFWSNPWLPPLDGITLYGLIAEHRPSVYMEVGSGFSTKFARLAVRDHGLDTRIISIDPQPRAEVDVLCDEVIRTPYEQVDPGVLDRLGSGDMLFVDNSHRSFTSSDVTVFFTESLPYLASGVLYGLHDIFLPDDYPEAWNDRFYAEQYLLMSYLLGGAAGDRIELPVHHVATTPSLSATLAADWPAPSVDPTTLVGGGFWMRRA